MLKKTKNETNNSNFESIFEESLNEDTDIKIQAEKKIPIELIAETIDLFRQKSGFISNGTSFTAIALLLQKGGVNSNKNTLIQIIVDSTPVDSKTLNGIIRLICKNASPRSFARVLSNEIFQIAKKHNGPGNLKQKLEKNYTPEWDAITDEDKIFWASDFQSANPNCPDEIKYLIRKNYQEQFTNSPANPSNKTTFNR